MSDQPYHFYFDSDGRVYDKDFAPLAVSDEILATMKPVGWLKLNRDGTWTAQQDAPASSDGAA